MLGVLEEDTSPKKLTERQPQMHPGSGVAS